MQMSRGNGNELLDNNDFVFMPMLNPDGYEYSWTNVSPIQYCSNSCVKMYACNCPDSLCIRKRKLFYSLKGKF